MQFTVGSPKEDCMRPIYISDAIRKLHPHALDVIEREWMDPTFKMDKPVHSIPGTS